MKKLMIALAAVALAAGANAAVVQWKSGTMAKDSKGAAIEAKDIITAYVYEISAAQFATYSAMDAATLSKTIAGVWGTEDMPGTADGSMKNIYARKAASADVTGTISHTAGTQTADAYALIVYTDVGNPDYYLANLGKATIEGSADVPVGDLYNTFGGTAGGATAWAQAGAVPEPTSGLLLLLGVAGLALRRRRA